MKHLVLMILTMASVVSMAAPKKAAIAAETIIRRNENPPYDAEVEYLEDDGTAYVFTGILCSSSLKVEGEMMSYEQASYPYGVFGYQVWQACLITHDWIGFWNGNRAVLSLLNTVNSRISFSVDFGNRKVVRNGAVIYDGSASPIPPTTSPYVAKLFNTGEKIFRGRVFWFRIYDGNNLVRDLVPVRRIVAGEPVGELYDRCTGTFMARVGNFVIGPDKE